MDKDELVIRLNDSNLREEYKKPYDNYVCSFVPRVLGFLLVWCGNIVYGVKPSYLKFRAVEIIARVPYHSWAGAVYTLLTLFYGDEERAIKLSKISMFSSIAQDNETMHVVVITQLTNKEPKRGNPMTHTIIPLLFSFLYFWAAYWLYLINPKYSLELNYLFEQHAFDQYSFFLKEHEEELKKKPIQSDFLIWYGRQVRSQYEFFETVRNDELIHRNRSIQEIELAMSASELA